MRRGEKRGVVIAGAGCAGLSLAVHLVQAGFTDRRILLIDPRTAYYQDRTWCFWNTGSPTPFDGAVTHTWNQWRTAAAAAATGTDTEVIKSSTRFTYQHLPAHEFYRTALGILGGFSNVEIRLGRSVEAMYDEGSAVRVLLDDGSAVTAPLVFDSRPCQQVPAGSVVTSQRASRGRAAGKLIQHFLGVRVRADRDVFDSSVATLMDFRLSQENGIHFMYILPFSSREALLETTYISHVRLTREEYMVSLQSYCAVYFPGTTFSIIEEETGVIPMRDDFPRLHRNSPRIIPAGVGGGIVKSSTGYAFRAIQHWSAKLACQMAQGVEVPVSPAPRSRRAAFMDHIFLSYLREFPAEAPALFVRLFRNTPADSLVRFLSDTGSLRDDVAVIRALPKTAFVMHAGRELIKDALSSRRIGVR